MRLQDVIAKAQREMAGGPVELALGAVRELDNLRPLHVPPPAVLASELRDKKSRLEMSTEQQFVHAVYCDAVEARVSAIAENERRLTTTLWAEQELRRAGRPEAELVRDFNRMEWGVLVPAPEGCDGRHTIMKERTAQLAVRLNQMQPSAASNNQQRHLKAVE
jgi:hypothetical protein